MHIGRVLDIFVCVTETACMISACPDIHMTTRGQQTVWESEWAAKDGNQLSQPCCPGKCSQLCSSSPILDVSVLSAWFNSLCVSRVSPLVPAQSEWRTHRHEQPGGTKRTAFKTVLKYWALHWSFATPTGTETSSTKEGYLAGGTDTLNQGTKVCQLTFYWITKTRRVIKSRTSSCIGKMSLCSLDRTVCTSYTQFLLCNSQGSTLSIVSFT